MNYYERFCGDYMRDTGHLSLAANGAYTVLLDTQYATERGLPVDLDDLYRICRAMTKDEQASVRRVADEFFPIGPDGLRWNPRAFREIADAQARINAARANGSRGGRPRKETQEKPSGFPPGSETETQEEPKTNLGGTRVGDTIPHTPKEKPKPSRSSDDDRPPDGFAEFWIAYPRKVKKRAAIAAWRRLKPDDALRARIMSALAADKRSDDWTRDDGRFVPHPPSWLNGARWDDDRSPAKSSSLPYVLVN